MGLSVVHGIVANAGGTVTVRNRRDRGCRFDVYLPVMADPAQEDPKEVGALKSGTERILFVDDETFQADLAAQALGRLGYEVVTRTSSIEALSLFRKDPAAFDLVITDMTMPQMAGKALAVEMHALRPDLPIILSSGFSSSISDDTAREMGFCAYLKKPLAMRELALTVRAVLDGGGRAIGCSIIPS
jgi:CheY-like chemotaxis protein